MLKGLALTPPILGRISIGHVLERNGKRLPQKDDGFTITTQIQGKDGWLLHPLDTSLRKTPEHKLRSIPIRLLFDNPDLSFRANYTLFDRRSGRPVCVGDGQTCRRSSSAGIQSLPCPTPMGCPLGVEGSCKPYGRLHVRIGDDDDLGCFVFRTTGFNSIRTLMTRLRYFQAVSGDRLSCMRLELKLRGKSTALSHRAPIYYVDVTIPQGNTLMEIVQEACDEKTRRVQAGLRQDLLDQAALEGLALGAFEESEEEGMAVLEEFYPTSEKPEQEDRAAFSNDCEQTVLAGQAVLANKLQRKHQQVNTRP
ncbi:MAG: hypothetical protein K5880_02260 [Hydrogenophaga sp.]|uniref:recombination directionality factor n=1 Tax=Hydrogenophaga sp. TaxID=1904254 RepID=UPI00261CC31C|nr:hypothetical protein [Hydrogenophaga sp.]MCV0437427.1 hypothetical protein [Hydrogenophaga sp.]